MAVRLSVGTVLLCVAALGSGGCGRVDRPHLQGQWVHKATLEGKSLPFAQLNFKNDSNYVLSFYKSPFSFEGTATVVRDTMFLIDKYCGTKFKGVYLFALRNDSLTYTMIGDKYCQRQKVFPGTWTREAFSEDSMIPWKGTPAPSGFDPAAESVGSQ